MSPLALTVIIAAVACAFAWTASLATGDTSWVDRMWSVVPVIYLWVFAVTARLTDTRLDVMAALITLWGLRLTYNFARKGGYRGVEDYRWAVLRASMRPWQFQLFNLFFIVLYQNALLVLITLPAWTVYQHRSASFGALDLLLTGLFLLFTIGETVADQQQWNFHQRKRAEELAGRTPNPRFLQSGLFRFSRHPAYFFELAQWWVVFFFGAVAARTVLEWTVIGPFLLTMLFVGSTRFTEKISLSRYPEYELFQRSTSAVIPWFAHSVAVVQELENEERRA
jgi:steroid 5-alpha reductase family enzyme